MRPGDEARLNLSYKYASSRFTGKCIVLNGLKLLAIYAPLPPLWEGVSVGDWEI